VADTVPLFWYGRSLVLLKQGRDREAIDACDSCLQYAPDHVDALYNKGIASLNLAVVYTEQACTDLTNPQCRRDQEIIQSLYNLAKLPMERVRALEPDKPQRWAPPLYRIYLNLNMGKEFDEIDRILHSN
jgi:tetratricopeptide (TPR) repeat protein